MTLDIVINKAKIDYDYKEDDYNDLIFTKSLLYANWINKISVFSNFIFRVYLHILKEPIINKEGIKIIALLKPYEDYKEFHMEELFRYGDCINKEKYNKNQY